MPVIGIYSITHIDTGRAYVGQSLNVKKRLGRHRLELNQRVHTNKKLQRAWIKYGEDAFDFSILEELQDGSLLTEREQFWMDANPKLYNFAPAAGSCRGMKLTKAQRAKISAALKGKAKSAEHRASMKQGARARVRTDQELEHWKNIWVGRSQTPEHSAKIGAAVKAAWAKKRAEQALA